MNHRISVAGKKIRQATLSQKTCPALKPLRGASPVIEHISRPKSTAIKTRMNNPAIELKIDIKYAPLFLNHSSITEFYGLIVAVVTVPYTG